MFPIECKKILPVENVIITSLSVRGQLGPLTVWVTKDPYETVNEETGSKKNATCSHGSKRKVSHIMSTRSKTSKRASKNNVVNEKLTITANPSEWTKIYENTLSPSIRNYKKLDLSECPICLKPGQVRGIYVHSALDNDEAIVYDKYLFNDASEIPQDSFIRLRPAMAHVSPTPFGRRTIWGYGMGQPWRQDRKFVGNIEYGVIYKLWNPKEHLIFGSSFQTLALQLFACQRRAESPINRLPDDCIFYILNMCKWDWVGDDLKGMKKLLEARKMKKLIASQNEAEDDKRIEQAKGLETYKKEACTKNDHIHSDETSGVDYDDEVDYENEDDVEVDIEYDEDWYSDSDDDDLYSSNYKYPVLYREGEVSESNRSYATRSRQRRGNNYHFVSGNFLAAFFLAANGEDDSEVEAS